MAPYQQGVQRRFPNDRRSVLAAGSSRLARIEVYFTFMYIALERATLDKSLDHGWTGFKRRYTKAKDMSELAVY